MLSKEVRHASSMQELLSTCDYVTIHVPLTEKNPGMIGEKEIAQLKNGSVFLNFSRDKLVDEAAMERAAALLCGTHDFAAFTTQRPGKKSTVRTLRSVEFLRNGDELDLCFTGDGFLYNMVRILTGTLLEVGLGRRSVESVLFVLESWDRSQAGPTAPAQGLTLWSLEY